MDFQSKDASEIELDKGEGLEGVGKVLKGLGVEER